MISNQSNLQKQPPRRFYNKDVPKIFAKFTEKRLDQSLFFDKAACLSLQLYWKKTLPQAYAWEFQKIFKNSFFTEHLRWLLLNCQINPSLIHAHTLHVVYVSWKMTSALK